MRTALILALALAIAACGPAGPTSSGTGTPGTAGNPGQVASGPRITPPPVTPPTPPASSLPAFACANAGGGTAGIANVTAVRVAAQSGYDRFVLQFDSSVPAYTVKRQGNPVFKKGPSGQTVILSGTAGAVVQVHAASEGGTYSGPTDFLHPEYPVLKEAQLIEDFEGYVSWGLGLSRAACMRTFIPPSDPPRLVIDFTTASS